MPGRFGGDYDQYDDEELDDDDLNNLEEDEEEEDDEELDEEESDELEEEIEGEIKEEDSKKTRANNRAIENRLKRIRRTAPYRFYPHFTISERVFLNKARKTHPRQVASLERLMLRRKDVFRLKSMSAGSSVPYILIFALILVVAVFVIAALGSLLSFLSGDDPSDGTASAQFGVNGEDFYGVRVVYTDSELAEIKIVENYINTIQNAVESIESEDLDITIDFPAEDFDYSTLDLEAFASDYASAYQIFARVVDTIYRQDAESMGDTANDELTIQEKIDAIRYFGLNSDLANEIASVISSHINDQDLYTIQSDEETGEDILAVEQQIADGILLYFTENDFVRLEKYFIKDYIFESAEDMMENIVAEEYVAMIFMPKTQVQFSRFSFIVSLTNLDTFNLYVQQGSEIVNFTSEQLTSAEDGAESNLYSTDDDLNITAQVYENIDINNLNYLSAGMSLLDILNGEIDYNIYLNTATNQEEEVILTFKQDGVITYFEAEDDFIFVEYETSWQ